MTDALLPPYNRWWLPATNGRARMAIRGSQSASMWSPTHLTPQLIQALGQPSIEHSGRSAYSCLTLSGSQWHRQ